MTRDLPPDRDLAQVEALMADHYLDALLAAADRRADDVPADAELDPELREAARVLRRALVRIHPSFRFEERLATRLAGLAETQSRPAIQVVGGGSVVPFPTGGAPIPTGGAARAATGASLASTGAATPTGGLAALAPGRGDADPLLAAILAGELDPTDDDAVDRAERLPADRRPLLVGGAITSAAISIVGVAWVAWRASRPAGRPSGVMGRAARSAHARRAAALAGAGLVGRA